MNVTSARAAEQNEFISISIIIQHEAESGGGGKKAADLIIPASRQ